MTNKQEYGHSITPFWRTHLRPAMTALLVGTLTLSATRAHSQDSRTPKPPSFSVLYTFTGGADGANPGLGGDSTSGTQLVIGDEGSVFGTAGSGGSFDGPCGAYGTYGCGVVFKVDRRGKETVLHAFIGPTDGRYPYGTLVRDHEGNFYGTTFGGGSTYCDGGGCGTVFKLDRSGELTTLYSFTNGADGGEPTAGLLRDEEGTLYGTTYTGGSYGVEYGGYGVVFRLDRTGKETVLHSFAGGSDGRNPNTSLVRDEEGNLYGTTPSGGGDGLGIIFKLDRSGKETVLYTFTGGADGGNPGGLVRGTDGTLYGAATSGFGNIFKLDEHREFTVLYSFTGGTDGWIPYGTPLLVGSDLYGTTFFGGDPSACGGGYCGVVFKLDAAGKETVLHSFTGLADGANPYSGLTLDREGNLYGSTGYGGDLSSTAASCGGIGCGVVFKIALHDKCDHDQDHDKQ